MRPLLLLLTLYGFATLASAQTGPELDTSSLPEPGSVAEAEGLAAWERIHAVTSHPRCVNCHVGSDNVPLWGTLSKPDRPHGMAIVAGESRIGAEGLSCNACHQTSTRPNDIAYAAPHTGMDWQLAPIEFQWGDRTSAEICEQMRDPERNGGRDAADLVEHILHDAELIGFITWSFNPGPGRDPAPGSLQSHLEDMAIWTAAGMPCPD
ncbi:hypothetical protein R5H30_19785 [Sulfitobacter sp. D35]|uniref:hypothetical protein n=1 Tax=Sulfitobacter sp. D35 TaxID=3083252 RepID=UPI00296E85FE|nr:hypothetical protein [Sulfitobacter sp. D35]MDW4500238.1 hypothetical protein [Sulfitobacter sp. D35]